MTILSDGEISIAMADGTLIIEPDPDLETQLQPSSLDLRLGDRFTRFKPEEHGEERVIDMRHTDVSKLMTTHVGDTVVLGPGGFVLAHTRERVKIPNDLVAVVDGRSSLGRMGLMVHVTAGYIDPGFEGQITLELHNVGEAPIRLYAGDRVCQLRFHRMAKPAVSPYAGKYQGDTGAVASRIHKDERGS